jgi:thiol-disulfide isomerase/thioredoxin
LGDGMKCVVVKPGDSRKVIVFTAKWCGACEEAVPRILELARLGGFAVELIDVDGEDPADRRRSRPVRYVPCIEYMGLEISFGELVGIIREVGGA